MANLHIQSQLRDTLNTEHYTESITWVPVGTKVGDPVKNRHGAWLVHQVYPLGVRDFEEERKQTQK